MTNRPTTEKNAKLTDPSDDARSRRRDARRRPRATIAIAVSPRYDVPSKGARPVHQGPLAGGPGTSEVSNPKTLIEGRCEVESVDRAARMPRPDTSCTNGISVSAERATPHASPNPSIAIRRSAHLARSRSSRAGEPVPLSLNHRAASSTTANATVVAMQYTHADGNPSYHAQATKPPSANPAGKVGLSTSRCTAQSNAGSRKGAQRRLMKTMLVPVYAYVIAPTMAGSIAAPSLR